MKSILLLKKYKSIYIISFLSIIFFILFVKLSIWQFNRSIEKADLLQKINDSLSLQSITTLNQEINPLDINKITQYSQVTLEGYFDEKHSIILDNQYYQHQPGYHLITPFILKNSNNAILINRGFITSQELSILNNKNYKYNNFDLIVIKGIVRNSNSHQYIMGDNLLKQRKFSNLPQIQKIDLNDSSIINLFNYPISGKYINLLSPKSAGYILDWQWTNITPEKHKAYALTWLLLAFSVILLYSYFCYISIKNK